MKQTFQPGDTIFRAEIRHGDYREVLSDVKADLIFTSPQYNIGSAAPRKDGFRRLGKFDPKSFGAIRDYPDDFPEPEYQDQQAEFMCWTAAHLKPNGVLVYNHKPRRKNKRLTHPAEWFLRAKVRERLVLMEEVVWDRGSTHNHDLTQMWQQTESLYVFRRPDGIYPLRTTKDTPQRSNVWRINRARKNGHPSPFPEDLAEAVVLAWSLPGELVVDPYAGSCTVAVAAQKLGRQCICAEIIEKYCVLGRERLTHNGGGAMSTPTADGLEAAE